MISRTRTTLLACALLGAVVLAGCGSSDPVGGAEPTSVTTSAPVTSTAPTSTPTPSDTPVAMGPKVRLDGLTATLPDGYRVVPSDAFKTSLVTAHVPGTVRFATLQTVTSGSYDQSTTQAADAVVAASGYLTKPQRRPDVVVDGVRMYHLEGRISPSEDVETYGSQSTGFLITIELKWERGVPLAERRATAASLLDSVRVRQG